MNTPWAPEAALPLLSSHCVRQSPALNSAPLWGLTQTSETNSPIPSWVCHQLILCFLSKSLLCPETPWNNMGFTWQDSLTSLKDPNFLFIVVWMSQSSKSIWSIFFISLSRGIYFVPDMPPPVCFLGEDADFGPQLLSFPSPLPGQRPALGWPSWARQQSRLWKPAHPHCPPSLATAACPPHPPCSFSQWASAPVPQCAAGNRGLSPALASAPHIRTFRHQWETARSVSIAPFFGALRATFSTAICSLSPLWTMLLFKASDSSSFIPSSPASPSSALPPFPYPHFSQPYEITLSGETTCPSSTQNCFATTMGFWVVIFKLFLKWVDYF